MVQSSAYPATPTSTPAEGTFCSDAPIQFDLTTPGECSSPKEGPPKYVGKYSMCNFVIFSQYRSNSAGVVLMIFLTGAAVA